MNEKTNESGSEIEFSSGYATIRGELFAAPAERAPGLVLLPDVHGISPLYREIAAKLAAAGLHVLVLDIYSREGAPRLADMAAVQAWIAALPDARVLGDVQAAIDHLRQRADTGGRAVGIMGFCLGGQYALMAGCRFSELAACVAFYGMLRHGIPGSHKLPPPVETGAALRCPLLGLFGAEDALIPAEDLRELETEAAKSGQPFAVHAFAGAGHAFMNDRRPEAYRREAAQEAMDLTIAFLRRTLSA